MTHEQWKDRFAKFIDEVPFEKKHSVNLNWTVKHEQMVYMYFGIKTKKQSASIIAEILKIDEKEVERVIRQARYICEHYYVKQKREEKVFYRRNKLAEDIRTALRNHRF